MDLLLFRLGLPSLSFFSFLPLTALSFSLPLTALSFPFSLALGVTTTALGVVDVEGEGEEAVAREGEMGADR